MIEPEREQAQSGTGAGFTDGVSVEFCDPERELCVCASITRLPNARRSRASAIVFLAGEVADRLEPEREVAIDDWSKAGLDGVEMGTQVPLERWSLAVSGERASLRLEAVAVSPPRELPDPTSVNGGGVRQYEQVCRMEGEMKAAGETHPVGATGRRVHRWGELAWSEIDRRRTLYAVS